jgi:mRNA interferase RelE/StbE
MHEIVYSAKARNDLKRLDLPVARRIIKKLKSLSEQEDPLVYAKPLKNHIFGEYRFRIGAFRVLFDYDSHGKIRILKVLRIGHRKEIYYSAGDNLATVDDGILNDIDKY